MSPTYRFRKSFGRGPFRMTISKRGVSYSVGIPGVRYTVRANGDTQLTTGIPGTGYSVTRKLSSGTSGKRSSVKQDPDLDAEEIFLPPLSAYPVKERLRTRDRGLI
jgi:hypothetical protein